MKEDRLCKNLLVEQTCDYCEFEEENFCLKHIYDFPYEIPEFHSLLLVERRYDGVTEAVTAYLKGGCVFIKGEDFIKDAKYLIHMRYPECERTHEVIPSEMTCELFSIKKQKSE
jgi:hypothetical protein